MIEAIQVAAMDPAAAGQAGAQGPGTGGLSQATPYDVREFAAALVCTDVEPPCGVCRACRQVAADAHPDVLVVAPQEGTLKIDPVRDLQRDLALSPYSAHYRIALLLDMHLATEEAGNALLKTLEEPPAETIFLLISHRPGQLLPTIRSRCHNLALRPVGAAAVRSILVEHDPALGQVELDRAVALAGGRPRRAFETLALAPESALGALQAWLANPAQHPAGVSLKLADALGADSQGIELAFAREMLDDWIADEARNAALPPLDRRRLASANELWDKAHTLFAEADSINLDMKQTLVVIFDAIRKHVSMTAALSSESQ